MLLLPPFPLAPGGVYALFQAAGAGDEDEENGAALCRLRYLVPKHPSDTHTHKHTAEPQISTSTSSRQLSNTHNEISQCSRNDKDNEWYGVISVHSRASTVILCGSLKIKSITTALAHTRFNPDIFLPVQAALVY